MKPEDLVNRANFHGRRGWDFLSRFPGQAPDQRQARKLAAQAESLPEPTGKNVLFVTPRDWFSHLHWEGMMAQALRIRGANVSFLTCGGSLGICDRATTYEAPPMPCNSCRRNVLNTITAHGFPISLMSPTFETVEGDWPELDDMDLDQLNAVIDSGLPLGKLVEIPVKWFLLNTTLEDDALGVGTYREFLRSARKVVAGVRQRFSEDRPDVLVMLNGLFFFESLAWAVAKEMGIETVIYERGYIHGTLQFARERPAGFGFVDEAWEDWKDTPISDDERTTLRQYLKDRELGLRASEQYWDNVEFKALERTNDRKVMTLFANITWDSAVINRDVAFTSIHDWIFNTIDYFAAHPEHDLVIRLHPAEIKLRDKPTREPIGDAIAGAYPELPPNVRVIPPDDPISSYPLMTDSDAVTVLTSTVGLEAALRGVPVLVTGKTAYRGKGFTHDATDPEQYWNLIDEVLADPEAARPDLDWVERYGYLFFFRTPFQSPGVTEPVPGIARIDTDLSRLEPGVQPDLDRICAGILDGGDLFAVPPSIDEPTAAQSVR